VGESAVMEGGGNDHEERGRKATVRKGEISEGPANEIEEGSEAKQRLWRHRKQDSYW